MHNTTLLCAMLAGLLTAPAALGQQQVNTTAGSAGETVLVAGATGRLGSHLIQLLYDAGYTVRGMSRDPSQAELRYGDQYDWIAADLTVPDTLPAAVAGVDRVICAVASNNPTGANNPETIDYVGTRNLIDASVAAGVKQFVLVSSVGVTQRFHLLNLTYGEVLIWKREAEEHLRASGLVYTIVRPGGLRPGPASVEGVAIAQGDAKGGSYIFLPDAAAVMVATIGNPSAYAKTFEILNDREQSVDAWRDDFALLIAD